MMPRTCAKLIREAGLARRNNGLQPEGSWAECCVHCHALLEHFHKPLATVEFEKVEYSVCCRIEKEFKRRKKT